MKFIVILIALSQAAYSADTILIRAATVKISDGSGFCSGICVSPDGDILTAEHCQMKTGAIAEFQDGRKLPLTLVYDPPRNNMDEACRLKVKGSDFPFIPISATPPKTGDKVASLGFPHSTFSYMEGTVTGINGNWVHTDMSTIEGHSGGPLINEAGELVGLCNGYEANRKYGNWIGLDSIQVAMDQVKVTQNAVVENGTVVIFSFQNERRCAPCKNLMTEIRNGFMSEYELAIYKIGDDGKWGDSEGARLYEEFRSGPGRDEGGLPVIWVYGTSKYRSGFDPGGKLSILSFIKISLDSISELVIGQPIFPSPPRTKPAPGNWAATSPSAPDPRPSTNETSEVSDLRSELAKVREDLRLIREGGIFEKVGAVNSIRDDLGSLRQSVTDVGNRQSTIGDIVATIAPIRKDIEDIKSGSGIEKVKAIADLRGEMTTVKSAVTAAKDDMKTDPVAFIIGAFGVFSGLYHEWLRGRGQGE